MHTRNRRRFAPCFSFINLSFDQNSTWSCYGLLVSLREITGKCNNSNTNSSCKSNNVLNLVSLRHMGASRPASWALRALRHEHFVPYVEYNCQAYCAYSSRSSVSDNTWTRCVLIIPVRCYDVSWLEATSSAIAWSANQFPSEAINHIAS